MERIEESVFPSNIKTHIKNIIGEKKKYNKIFRDEFLKEEIERYLKTTLIQLILVSGVYNDDIDTSKREEFTLDMVDSIFNDDNVVYQDENIVLTLGYLIRELNTKYGKIEDFYAPIKEFRQLAIRTEKVYKREYDKNGIKGLKDVYDSFDILLDERVNKGNLDKVSPSKTVQRDLVNMIILNRRGLPIAEIPEQIEDNFYTQMDLSFQKEKKNNQYKNYIHKN